MSVSNVNGPRHGPVSLSRFRRLRCEDLRRSPCTRRRAHNSVIRTLRDQTVLRFDFPGAARRGQWRCLESGRSSADHHHLDTTPEVDRDHLGMTLRCRYDGRSLWIELSVVALVRSCRHSKEGIHALNGSREFCWMNLFPGRFRVRKRRTADREPIGSTLRNPPKQIKEDCNSEWLRSPNSYNGYPVFLPRMGHMAVCRCKERSGGL